MHAQQPSGSIYGRVTESHGQPQRVLVHLLSDGDMPAGDTYTDSNGGFAFNALPNGEYFLVVEQPGYRAVRQAIALSFGTSPSVRVNIALEPVTKDPKGISPVIVHDTQSYKLDAANSGRTPNPKALREFAKASAKERNGELQAAVDHYRKALQLQPDFYPALNNLGTVFLKQKDNARAEAAFLKSIQINSRDGQAFVNLGHLLYEEMNYPEAIKRLQQGLERTPDSAAGHFFMGSAYLRLGDLDKAEQNLKAAYALDPASMPSAQLQLANLYLKRHDMQAAGVELSSYLAANPSDPQAPAMKRLLAKIKARQAN